MMITSEQVRSLAQEITDEATRQIDDLTDVNSSRVRRENSYVFHAQIMASGSDIEDFGKQCYLAKQILNKFTEGQPEMTEVELDQALTTLKNTETYLLLHPETT